jgi:hypothetical protein
MMSFMDVEQEIQSMKKKRASREGLGENARDGRNKINRNQNKTYTVEKDDQDIIRIYKSHLKKGKILSSSRVGVVQKKTNFRHFVGRSSLTVPGLWRALHNVYSSKSN